VVRVGEVVENIKENEKEILGARKKERRRRVEDGAVSICRGVPKRTSPPLIVSLLDELHNLGNTLTASARLLPLCLYSLG
jgi:hypothetical protein